MPNVRQYSCVELVSILGMCPGHPENDPVIGLTGGENCAMIIATREAADQAIEAIALVRDQIWPLENDDATQD